MRGKRAVEVACIVIACMVICLLAGERLCARDKQKGQRLGESDSSTIPAIPSIPTWSSKVFRENVLKKFPRSMPDSVLVVNFWATWCGPCVEELPEFVKLDSVIRAQKLPARVLMVSFDFKRDVQSKLIPFVSTHIPSLPCVLFGDRDMNGFIGMVEPTWSGSLPGTLVVDKHGTCRTFVERQVRFDELLTIVNSCIHSQ